jgi:hypothetical protein
MSQPPQWSRCRSPSHRVAKRRLLPWLGTAALIAGCVNPADPLPPPEPPRLETATAPLVGFNLAGFNLAGFNLAGFNLAGFNLAGFNLGGPNMGGSNLAGFNLGAPNLSGTNMGGNNLAGFNLADTNLGAANLAGFNLAGFNLAGFNLAATNLSGSNVAGTNLAGFNLAGFNLAGFNLAGPSTGSDIHALGRPIDGMLYSGEDLWMPRSGQCIVLGIGSTAFAKLLGQQSKQARIAVALGKLPWGFPGEAGGPVVMDAWEAVVWGDQSYCTFLLVAPPGSSWAGVAGFIKAVFRWNAPPAQSVDITGIEASAAHDPTLSTEILTYTGMMNAGAQVNAGVITATDYVAGLLGFVTATTNNQTVRVDFSAWVRDSAGGGKVLGNVERDDTPQYAEGVYHVHTNPDGTAAVALSQVAVGSGLISSQVDLANSWIAYLQGHGPRPIPNRCSAALYLNAAYGEPIPGGKCDSGLTWVQPESGYPSGKVPWSSVPGTTAPMNEYMYLPAGGADPYLRSAGKPIRSETYIFMWEPNHALPAAAIGGASGSDRTSLGVAVSNATSCAPADVAANAFTSQSSLKWCALGLPSSSSPRSIMYMWGAALAITSYRITSAADWPARDPRSWTFQGCGGSCTVGSDSGWVTLDTRTNQTFSGRLQSRSFSFGNTTAYPQYRLRITANYANGSSTQLRELQMFDGGGPVVPLAGVDRTENGIVTWAGQACNSRDLPTRVFDNLMTSAGGTQWCVLRVASPAAPVSIAYTFGGPPQTVTSYKLTSAADQAARDPRSWTLQGCAGGCRVGAEDGWVTLDTRSNESFASRYQTRSYSFTNTTPYAQYRLRITAGNGDSTSLQLAELQLY